MRFLVVSHRPLALNRLANTVRSASHGTEVVTAPSVEEALALPALDFDVAFLDAGLGGRTHGEPLKLGAVDLAGRLKRISRNTHVIFVAESKKYYEDAFSAHADACLLEPVAVEDIQRELDYLSYSYPAPLTPRKVFIQTFGEFNVLIDGAVVPFKRNKSKELLALLVHRRGAGLRSQEGCEILFGNESYREKRSYYHVLITSMIRTLEGVGLQNILVRDTRSLAVNPGTFECDAYRYLKEDPAARHQYHGDYMAGYAWAHCSSKDFAQS